jgi:hypothetical protein
MGEFLTEFVPGQRTDRLYEYVEHLSERMAGLEEELRSRMQQSPAYAHLLEETSLAAVRTASTQRRRDLAALLRTGLSKSDAELVEHHALLSLLERLNDPQVLILMRYGAFGQSLADPARQAFEAMHAAVLDVHPPTFGDGDDAHRRWTMYTHYEDQLIALGLLKDTEGLAKSNPRGHIEITQLGSLLLESIERGGGDHAES